MSKANPNSILSLQGILENSFFNQLLKIQNFNKLALFGSFKIYFTSNSLNNFCIFLWQIHRYPSQLDVLHQKSKNYL